jgi:acyl-CoA synthetase (AMP-forming)/AMP-acid ligase II
MIAANRLRTRLSELGGYGRALPALLRGRSGAAASPAGLLDRRVAAAPDDPGLLFADQRFTWREIDHAVNRAAHVFARHGVGPGDVVVVLMDNRPEFLFAVTALSRLRAVAALVNTNIAGPALVHAIRVAEPRRILVGAEHAEKVAEALVELTELSEKEVWEQSDSETDAAPRFASFDALVANEAPTRPPSHGAPRSDERMGYIYTSGTTGFPKAAIITNQRFVSAGALLGRGIYDLSPGDVTYVALPLYHSAAFFGGWAGALISGACLALRRRFSASRFWDDVRRFDATVFVYIGELCRYLLNQPEHADERNHRLRMASGNGLRPDIWQEFQDRFAIPLIREYYGATEGTVPLVNFTGRPGMVGRLLPVHVVVRCDLETGEIWRGASGHCERVAAGETGLLLGRIAGASRFDGYVDEAASNKKILSGVFSRGDRYFDSGDLVTLHEDGWIAFADRVGDTFRWKGENVSTNEVAEILNGFSGVIESNVYGVEVPGAEGRAGMASLHVDENFSIEALADFVCERLPAYQRPYFVRIQRDMRITGTFKHQKVDYRREGYDPSRVADPLYLLDGSSYLPLDEEVHEGLKSGTKSLR